MSEKKPAKKLKLTSIQTIMLGFLGFILVGTIILYLPFSTAAGEHTSFMTALFTATTSICVTGLVVVDTYSHWSLFGKIMILTLVQLGGFGVITFYSMAILAMNRRFSLKLRLLIQDYYNLDSIEGLIHFLKHVVLGTLFVEGFGAVLYSFIFVPKYGIIKGIWVSIFNAVSAFCNAGMDIMGPDSLISYQSNVPVIMISIFLIVMGGLGYVVWFDLYRTARRTKKAGRGPIYYFKHLNEQSKLVLVLTITITLISAVLIFIFEHDNPETMGNMTLFDKLMNSLFQSVTFRTAGFASVPQDSLTPSTCILGFICMFTGGSPVGTAGGVKNVTIFIVFLNSVSFIRNRDEVVVFNRSVDRKMINKANAIVSISLIITVILTVMMIAICKVDPIDAGYEIFSATATVGLSRGLTGSLGTAGQIIVIIAMYLGRIGPISMALFFAVNRPENNDVNYAKGHYIIG